METLRPDFNASLVPSPKSSHHLQKPSLRPRNQWIPQSPGQKWRKWKVWWLVVTSCTPPLCSRSWALATFLTSRGSELYLLTVGATVGWEHGGRSVFSLFLSWTPRTAWFTEALEHWERKNESFVGQIQEVIGPWVGLGTSFLWWSVCVGERNCALNSKWLL